MQIYPRILTKEQYKTYLPDVVVNDHLTNYTDLDVDLTIEPEVKTDAQGDPVLDDQGNPVLIDPATGEVYNEPPEDLVQARKELNLFVRDIEDEVLEHHTDTDALEHPSPDYYYFRGSMNRREVALQGYYEVTDRDLEEQAQEDADAAAAGTEPEQLVPTYPNGEYYNAGDPHILKMDSDLLLALRLTIAAVAEHETKRPSRHLESKSTGMGSKETYIQNERPMRLYRRLRNFDTSIAWH